jgi:hypothetical protein
MKWHHKLLIISIGLILITLFVTKYFDEPVQEGMTPLITMLGNTMTPPVIGSFVNSVITKIKDASKAISDKISFATAASSRAGYAAQEGTRDVAIAGAESGDRKFSLAVNTMDRQVKDITTKTMDISARLLAKLRAAYQWGKSLSIVLMIVGVALLLGGYVWEVMKWIGQFAVCTYEMLANFNSCFFYFFLDIVGYVLYLPFSIMFYLFRSGIETYYSDCKKEDYPPIYNIERDMWAAIYWLDCQIYDLLGFHVFHYSDEVLDRCYKCKIGPFPPFPNLFSYAGWVKAIKKYNLGNIVFPGGLPF